MFVDSHCHLSFPELRAQLPDLLAAMRAARVEQAICIATTLEEFPAVLALAEAHEELWATVGVHPDNEGVREPTVDDLVRLAAHPRVVGIGETGLDYYRLHGRSIEHDMGWQRERFRVHLRAARLTGKPLVIHTRSSSADLLAVLRDEGQGTPWQGVLHCFTEDLDTARAGIDMGLHVSFSGILTFKNAESLREVARALPRDRVLIETDSPYLAPVPYRGKTNQPAYVPHVAAELARLWGESLEAVAERTTANTRRLFTLPACVPA
ncbi:TatD family hydrolase [Inhella sp.]|uniref:TatD family hydrolase n=1 Tax=Inhella sp. TaxID=1921806 RepID=UPI0035B13BE4